MNRILKELAKEDLFFLVPCEKQQCQREEQLNVG